jgi:rare lipoprotein A
MSNVGQRARAMLVAILDSKIALGATIAACALVSGAGLSRAEEPVAATLTLSGTALWYGPGFHGRQTANGERYNMYELTAAHRSLPFGTKVRVTNRTNGKSVVVRINDRGPYVGQRVIDLSRGAAQAVSMTEAGIAPVKLDVLPSL